MKKNLKRDTNVLYLDANVFIFAAINTEELGEQARSLLSRIQRGEEKAGTSALTFDEVFWVIKKHNSDLAFEACHALLNFPNLEIIAANKELASSALQLIRDCQLRPRDALHAATAIAEKADYIVSEDPDFDRITQLKRKTLDTNQNSPG
jgi:predicted nucleic acid-binding protein